MALLRPLLLSALILCLLAPGLAQQPAAGNQGIFTLAVDPPTSAKDVQVRYYFTGEFETYGATIATPTHDNRIVIKNGEEGKPAKSFKLIAYAPGCQFVTISVDDLASSNRQGEFQCTRLNTVQFFGQANVSGFSGRALEVQIVYQCDWAADFFGKTAVFSPFSLGKADIASDGSFTISLPDFSADPLWSTLTNKARLTFSVADATTGRPLATLKVLSDSAASAGGLKVASSYPQVEFGVASN